MLMCSQCGFRIKEGGEKEAYMIRYTTGNIFESNAKCLVNTVNCEGYMGKGIAYQFKMRFPENNRDYVRACKYGNLRIGTIHYYIENGILIVNFPTKDKWREKSQMYYITGKQKRNTNLDKKKRDSRKMRKQRQGGFQEHETDKKRK